MKHLFSLIIISLFLTGCGIVESLLAEERPETAPYADRPPSLTLENVSIELDLGTYCWTSTEVGLCVDTIPPAYEADQHVSIADDSLQLSFDGITPSSVSAYVHPGSNLMTRIADIYLEATLDESGIVSIPLMEQLNGDYVLVVSAFWEGSPSGDAMYTLPITIE